MLANFPSDCISHRAVNFVFLIEADYQTGGLQVEVEDETWDALTDAVKDPVPSLLDKDIIEIHQWARHLAQNKQGMFEHLLEELPPQNRSLKPILTEMIGTTQLWNTHYSNEDTYLKSKLWPLLRTYFGNLAHTRSSW